MHKQGRFTAGLLTLTVVFCFLVSCSGGGGDGGNGGTGSDPVASAGPDQTVVAGSLVDLDGSGSSNASTYEWSFTSWPGGGSAPALSPSAAVSNPSFTASTAGSYLLSLVVSSGTKSSSDTVTVTAVESRPIPDTGQTKCYTEIGVETTCPGGGQDADYNDTNQPSYTDNGDETITDNVTGLMWQKCTMGQSGLNCTGSAGVANWYEASGTADATSNPAGATDVCGNLTLGPYSDWRLPTDFEFMTILNYGGTYAIDTTYFPNTQPGPYWSSTTFSELFGTPKAWDILISPGSLGYSLKTRGTNRVRCVRGAPSSPIFIDNGNGTVTDLVSGLMWQKQDDGTQRTWVNAMSYCKGLTLGGHNYWRLPNIKELRSIVDTTKWTPAVNTTYFPGTRPDPYWSSTTCVKTTNSFQAWSVDFNDGSVDSTMSKTWTGYVRCVR